MFSVEEVMLEVYMSLSELNIVFCLLIYLISNIFLIKKKNNYYSSGQRYNYILIIQLKMCDLSD